MDIKKLKVPLNEGEIKKHWIYIDRVYISSICFTFNQEGYIRDTIDCFLAQETKYRFEIIIHDDASTDGTRDILFEYKNKYPSIIKLILQEENQYSQGKQIVPLGVEHADGEYIAFCEGDDYWIDKKKLQCQIEILKRNKSVLVFSNAINSNNKVVGFTSFFYKNIKIKKLFKSTGSIIPTCTIFLKKEIFNNLPYIFNELPFFDYYLQIYSGMKGGISYDKNIRAYYRTVSIGSWSENQLTLSNEDVFKEYIKIKEININFFNEIKISPDIANDNHAINSIRKISGDSGSSQIIRKKIMSDIQNVFNLNLNNMYYYFLERIK